MQYQVSLSRNVPSFLYWMSDDFELCSNSQVQIRTHKQDQTKININGFDMASQCRANLIRQAICCNGISFVAPTAPVVCSYASKKPKSKVNINRFGMAKSAAQLLYGLVLVSEEF